MIGLIQQLQQKFNQIVSPYKPKQIVLPQSLNKPTAPVAKAVQKPQPLKPNLQVTPTPPPSAQRVNPTQPTFAGQQVNKNLITPFKNTVSTVNKNIKPGGFLDTSKIQDAGKNLQTTGAKLTDAAKKVIEINNKIKASDPLSKIKYPGRNLIDAFNKPQKDLGNKVTEIAANMPGALVSSAGKTAERWATPEGRTTAVKSIVKVLAGEVPLDKVMDEPGVEDVLNFTNLLTMGGPSAAKGAVGLTIKDISKVAKTEDALKIGETVIKEPRAVLSPEERAIHDKFSEHLSKNTDQVAADYKKKYGNVINTDNVREFSQDYVKDRNKLSAAVHEPASAFTKEHYARELKNPGDVIITAGGTGAGKTTGLNFGVPKNVRENASAILDGNLSNFDNATKHIDMALAHGKKVEIVYVHRTPEESLVKGALPRAHSEGRTVPIEAHVNTHVKAPQVLAQLEEKYKNNPNVVISVVDNTSGKGELKVGSVDNLKNLNYNKGELTTKLHQLLDNEYAKGNITKQIYEGTKRSGVGETFKPANQILHGGNQEGRAVESKKDLLTPFKKSTQTSPEVKQEAKGFLKSSQTKESQKGSSLKSETQSSKVTENPAARSRQVDVQASPPRQQKLPDTISLQSQLQKPNKQANAQSELLPKSLKGDSSGSSSNSSISDPVNKVIEAIKSAKPLNREQKMLYSQERSKRIGQAMAIGRNTSGEKGFFQQLSKLKGEMPKVQYDSVRPALKQEDIDHLFNKVKEANLSEFDKINASTALSKIFGKVGGQVPTPSEIKLLEKTFGAEFAKAIRDKRSFSDKSLEAAGQLLNLPRSIMSSFDLSAPLRQGALIATDQPKAYFKAFGSMFHYFGSKKAFKALEEEISSRPSYKYMRDSKLALTDMGHTLIDREEAFMSNWAERIPVLGMGVRASSRAYVGFLNKLRADSFDSLLKGLKDSGVNIDKNLDKVDSIAKYVNTATGRGGLGKLEKSATLLNSVFFSPRLMASRFNTLFNPVYYMRLDPSIRKHALKALVGHGLVVTTALGLAKAAGAEVETDPRSADFAKIKVGNTRFDIAGGFQQYIKLAGQMTTGQIKSTTTGNIMTLGEGYKALSPKDIVERFFESKTSPVASFLISLLEGKNTIGEPVKLFPKNATPDEIMSNDIISRFIPMLVGDAYDLYKEGGGSNILNIAPAIFGVGLQTYGGPKTLTSPEQAQGQGSVMLYKYLKTMKPAEKNAYLDKLNKDGDTTTISKLVNYKEIEAAGLGEKEMNILTAGVKNGERAGKIADELSKLKTKGEYNSYLEKLVKSGLLDNDNVIEQLAELKKQGKLKAPAEKNLLTPFK